MLIKRILISVLKMGILLSMIFFVLNIKKPLLFKIRHLENEIFYLLFVVSLVLVFINIWKKKRIYTDSCVPGSDTSEIVPMNRPFG